MEAGHFYCSVSGTNAAHGPPKRADLKISEGIVFHGIPFNRVGGGQRREIREVGQVAHCAVAELNAEHRTQRQALLISLPAQASLDELVANRFANRRRCRNGLHAIDVGEVVKDPRRYFVPRVNGRRSCVRTDSCDGADVSDFNLNPTRWRGSAIGIYKPALKIGEGPQRGLDEIHAIQDSERLANYPFYHAALGEFEISSGHLEDARDHFFVALRLARNPMEPSFFEQRIGACK